MNDRQRLEAVVDVVRSYLPPDGISREEAMSQIIALVDPLPAQPEQEPVAYMTYKGYLYHASDPKVLEHSDPTPLYTAPPSKPDVNQELVEALNTILWTRPPNKNPSRYAHTVEEIAFRALAKHDKLKEKNNG